jgi:predicted nucleic acid-binding protein
MVPVFVDTGGWIAMAVVRDQFHDHAALYYREMSGKKVPCDYFQLCLS